MAKKKPTPRTPSSPPKADVIPKGYAEFLSELKERIKTARLRTSLAVNRELIALYWQIGRDVVDRQKHHRWGNAVLDRLGEDLQRAFPGESGFSRTNLYRMRAFYLAYRDAAESVPQPVGQIAPAKFPQEVAAIPWGHNVVLVEQVKVPAARLWYARKTVENGWSRSVLAHWIESDLYERQGKASTNFERTLPKADSDLARETLKDPYKFEFLSLDAEAEERALEAGLLAHVQKFLVELGAGFAFVGRQVRLEVGGEDFFIDLLFYHLKLRCFIVVELKTTAFKPEYAGKMNFYLSAVDDLLRHPDDKPSIGIILCKARNKVVAEYALRDLAKPVGVSSYVTRLVESLPATFRDALPSPGELAAELKNAPPAVHEGDGE